MWRTMHPKRMANDLLPMDDKGSNLAKISFGVFQIVLCQGHEIFCNTRKLLSVCSFCSLRWSPPYLTTPSTNTITSKLILTLNHDNLCVLMASLKLQR